ncbi:DUF1266 domain-containing protein [Streptomyces sp. NPDC058000]|uniref:DUF1266 domain-containing protein n=1 Tax=Streptomyces sp. NPDC058000 TaxID=3346299 RepID=UPI0036E3F155
MNDSFVGPPGRRRPGSGSRSHGLRTPHRRPVQGRSRRRPAQGRTPRFGAGYVDEPGAWRLLGNAVAPAAQTYQSWNAFADDFIAGRALWMQNAGAEWSGSQDDTAQAAQRLLDPGNSNGPWHQVHWESIYQPDRAR